MTEHGTASRYENLRDVATTLAWVAGSHPDMTEAEAAAYANALAALDRLDREKL